MEREELQALLEKNTKTQKDMLLIAESYLRGDVLKDALAAEAWLHAVINEGETVEAVRAMELLGKQIIGAEEVLAPEDLAQIRRELETETSEERRRYLSALSELGQG